MVFANAEGKWKQLQISALKARSFILPQCLGLAFKTSRFTPPTCTSLAYSSAAVYWASEHLARWDELLQGSTCHSFYHPFSVREIYLFLLQEAYETSSFFFNGGPRATYSHIFTNIHFHCTVRKLILISKISMPC